MLAFLLCACSPGTEKELLEGLQIFKEIIETYIVYGEYDVISKIEVPDLKQLNNLIFKVRQNDKLRTSSTLIVIGAD